MALGETVIIGLLAVILASGVILYVKIRRKLRMISRLADRKSTRLNSSH